MADDTKTLRQLVDTRDVIRAIAAAARLLDKHLDQVEADVLDLMRRTAGR